MSAREELLSSSQLGSVGVALLYETVQVVGVARRFPPPEGHAAWDSDAVSSVAHDFVQRPRGLERLLDVALKSVDDRSFRRLLEAAVTNHLRDVARATDMGKLVMRVKEVLRSAPEFRSVRAADGEAWTLVDGRDEPSVVTTAVLVKATHGVEVNVPSWSSASRDAPLADHASFVRLMSAVLAAAGGCVGAVDIAHALGGRLNFRRVPLTVELDVLGPASEPTSGEVDPSTAVASALLSAAIFDGLTDRERLIVATIELSVRELGAMIGVGKSQAAEIRRRVVERVGASLVDDDEPDETVRALVERCDGWVKARTAVAGATS